MAEFDLEMVKLQIPDVNSGKEEAEVTAYIYTVDNLIRNAQNDNERTKICIVAKRKLEGQLKEAVMGCPDVWQNIRKIIVAATANRRAETAIIADMLGTKQGTMDLHQYHTNMKRLMLDLIVSKTENVDQARALQIEAEVRTQAKEQYIEGLETALNTYILQKNPETLEEAYIMAVERDERMKDNYQTNKVLETRKIEVPKNMEIRCRRCGKTGHAESQCYQKFCVYHNSSRHNTKACRSLMSDQAQMLIRLQQVNTQNVNGPLNLREGFQGSFEGQGPIRNHISARHRKTPYSNYNNKVKKW